jgi:pimeloyl-ACP methyl ester carboxylesterase
MPLANVRGVNINYEVLGDTGPWVALSPGGRRGLDAVKSLAGRIAAAGYRVLIHDRRNCGASDVVIEGEQSEYEIWADDLHELLTQLKALPAYVSGGSSGCRLSILFALRYPESVLGLLLWRVTGGRFAAQRLAENYYGQFIAAAQKGGVAAVCEMEHFRERIAARPSNRERLMTMDPRRFIDVMTQWREHFIRGADQPVIGASAEDLQSIAVATCIVPGNDKTHARPVGENLHRIMPNSELHILYPEHVDVDMVPPEEWNRKEAELAAIFVDFMKGAAACGNA